MTFVGADFEVGFLERDVLELQSCELTDPETSLQEKFDDPVHADVIFD